MYFVPSSSLLGIFFVWQVVAAMLEARVTTALAISVVVGLGTVEMEA